MHIHIAILSLKFTQQRDRARLKILSLKKGTATGISCLQAHNGIQSSSLQIGCWKIYWRKFQQLTAQDYCSSGKSISKMLSSIFSPMKSRIYCMVIRIIWMIGVITVDFTVITFSSVFLKGISGSARKQEDLNIKGLGNSHLSNGVSWRISGI